MADSHYDVSADNPVRMTVRQPLNTIPPEFYEINPISRSPGNTRNFQERNYFGGLLEPGSNRQSQAAAGISQGNQSARLPLIRPRLSRPQNFNSVGTPSDLGLLTFRIDQNGQSAIVIRHSEGLFQPGQVVGYHTELAFCFESKMCPICQEEWIWKIFTPAEMALLDPSGAEWEVARLPCGHVFHGACLAVWFHEISFLGPSYLIVLTFRLYGSPSCPCCRRQYRFREYRWSEAFCYEGWRLRYNWTGDREESSPDAYLDGRPHYPSISRRVSFTIRSQSEEQPTTHYISDLGQGSGLLPRRRDPSWTTVSSSGGGTILRRTRRTSRYVSDTLNALGEGPMTTLQEEPLNIFIAELGTRDLQALTPDMILYEPEYWSRYELELGEEGEGGVTGYEPILSEEGIPGDGSGSSWPHFGAYIMPQAVFSPLREPRLEEGTSTRQIHPQDTEQGAETSDTAEADDTYQLREGVSLGHDGNAPLNELLCQWNTHSTIGDVLRDFHWIIAYVLEGMQQYEAGMAPWPRVSHGFEKRIRNLTPDDNEGNISISSASRRVLSLLEGTGIPRVDFRHGSVVSRTSRIPRPAKKVEATLEDETIRVQQSMDQLVETNRTQPLSKLRNSGVSPGVVGVTLPERPDNLSNIENHLSRTLSWSVMEDNEKTNTLRSPDKRGDLYSRITDLGHTGSKIPVLSPRPDGGNVQSMKDENSGHKLAPKGRGSPRRGRRSKLMAGEMQIPIGLHLPKAIKATRDNSLVISRPDLVLTLSAQTEPEDLTYLERDQPEDVLGKMVEKERGDSGLDKENRRPDA